MVRLFDINDDGRIDYYEFISSLHPRDSYKPMNDADKIEDEVIREVAQCRCCDRFNIEQISDNKYRVSHYRMSFFSSDRMIAKIFKKFENFWKKF